MNNIYQNSFSRGSGPDASMRFNKRSRYGANNSGGNHSPRYKSQNQSAYQYSQNRNNTTDTYNPNQYENTSIRQFYSNSPKKSSFKQPQNKQSSPYSHTSAMSNTLSPSSSKFSASTHNALNLTTSHPITPSAQAASASNIAQNNQHQQKQFKSTILDNSNYYGLGYNFFPNSFNVDLYGNISNTTLGTADGMSPFMWQTITSTPPPKFQQKHQPPLPHQPPPNILPPLPPSSDSMPHLPPPPPIPVSIDDLQSETMTSEKADTKLTPDNESAGETVVKMKAKRNSMAVRCKLSKSWSEKDAKLALQAEETNKTKQRDIILIIRFPDPEINREIVKSYSPAIESVHFQLNFAPRYCLVHLKPDADVGKTIEEISNISFGTGLLSVEIKPIPRKKNCTKLSEVDPCTLYVGNLPTTIACKTLKQLFPGAIRIDIGFAQRIKYTRYAFVRYQNVEQAIEAYNRMLYTEIEGRIVVIRFRRLAMSGGANKDGEDENNDNINNDMLGHTAVSSDHATQLLKTISKDMEPINNTDDTINTKEMEKSVDANLAQENCLTETANIIEPNEILSPINCTENEGLNQAKSCTQAVNIKRDPDIDPDDIAIRNNTDATPFEDTENSDFKKERENLDLYRELFEKPDNQNDNCDKANRSDIISLASTADEMDTMSPLSSNSLGEFLQTCHRRQTLSDSIDELRPPPAKMNKVTDDSLQLNIKREPLEQPQIIENSKSLRLNGSVGLAPVKQEPDQSNEHLSTLSDTNSSAQNISLNADKTLTLSQKKSGATNSTNDCDNNSTITNDIVPRNALFFRSEYQNMTKACDYDEFYESRVSSQASISLPNIKNELFDQVPTRRTSNKNEKTMQQSETLNASCTVHNTALSTETSILNSTTTTSNTTDADELVPAQNVLASNRPLQNFVKKETEYDDIFSVPFHKEKSQLQENIGSRNNSVTSLTIHSNANTVKVSKTYMADDNDQDVIIVSDNIKRPVIKATSNNSVLTNLFTSKKADLVSFKPLSMNISNRETSNLINRYDLDKLYELLDADSDSEL